MLNTITHEIDLNMSQPNNFQYVHVMQNDYDAEYIKCTLYDGNDPYTVSCPRDSITVRCQLPNGRETEDVVESTSGNTVTFKVSSKMTQVKGNVLAALSLFDTNGRKSPFPFVIKVIGAPEGVTDDDIMYGKLAKYYADLAKSYAVGTGNEVRDGDATDNSKYYCEKSAGHAREAAETASNVKDSELSASKHDSNAGKSAKEAADSAKEAADSAKKAAQSEKNAADSADKSAQNNKDSKKYADLSKSYAVGTGNEIRSGDATDNSRYYWTLVKNAIDSGQLAEFEYFETYADFEKALQNNEIREDMLAVIKENIYKPSGTGNNDMQIDASLSDKSENAVQNKAITAAINKIETQVASLIKELAALKESIPENPGGSSADIDTAQWTFSCSGEQNFLTGGSSQNFITSEGSLEMVSHKNAAVYGTDKVEIAGREIYITGNNNGDIRLDGNVYVNGKLIT